MALQERKTNGVPFSTLSESVFCATTLFNEDKSKMYKETKNFEKRKNKEIFRRLKLGTEDVKIVYGDKDGSFNRTNNVSDFFNNYLVAEKQALEVVIEEREIEAYKRIMQKTRNELFGRKSGKLDASQDAQNPSDELSNTILSSSRVFDSTFSGDGTTTPIINQASPTSSQKQKVSKIMRQIRYTPEERIKHNDYYHIRMAKAEKERQANEERDKINSIKTQLNDSLDRKAVTPHSSSPSKKKANPFLFMTQNQGNKNNEEEGNELRYNSDDDDDVLSYASNDPIFKETEIEKLQMQNKRKTLQSAPLPLTLAITPQNKKVKIVKKFQDSRESTLMRNINLSPTKKRNFDPSLPSRNPLFVPEDNIPEYLQPPSIGDSVRNVEVKVADNPFKNQTFLTDENDPKVVNELLNLRKGTKKKSRKTKRYELNLEDEENNKKKAQELEFESDDSMIQEEIDNQEIGSTKKSPTKSVSPSKTRNNLNQDNSILSQDTNNNNKSNLEETQKSANLNENNNTARSTTTFTSETEDSALLNDTQEKLVLTLLQKQDLPPFPVIKEYLEKKYPSLENNNMIYLQTPSLSQKKTEDQEISSDSFKNTVLRAVISHIDSFFSEKLAFDSKSKANLISIDAESGAPIFPPNSSFHQSNLLRPRNQYSKKLLHDALRKGSLSSCISFPQEEIASSQRRIRKAKAGDPQMTALEKSPDLFDIIPEITVYDQKENISEVFEANFKPEKDNTFMTTVQEEEETESPKSKKEKIFTKRDQTPETKKSPSKKNDKKLVKPQTAPSQLIKSIPTPDSQNRLQSLKKNGKDSAQTPTASANDANYIDMRAELLMDRDEKARREIQKELTTIDKFIKSYPEEQVLEKSQHLSKTTSTEFNITKSKSNTRTFADITTIRNRKLEELIKLRNKQRKMKIGTEIALKKASQWGSRFKKVQAEQQNSLLETLDERYESRKRVFKSKDAIAKISQNAEVAASLWEMGRISTSPKKDNSLFKFGIWSNSSSELQEKTKNLVELLLLWRKLIWYLDQIQSPVDEKTMLFLSNIRFLACTRGELNLDNLIDVINFTFSREIEEGYLTYCHVHKILDFLIDELCGQKVSGTEKMKLFKQTNFLYKKMEDYEVNSKGLSGDCDDAEYPRFSPPKSRKSEKRTNFE